MKYNILVKSLIIVIIIVLFLYLTTSFCIQKFSNTNNKMSKKILSISCYGYGNMGDNMYSEVFKWGLSDCEIVKLTDSSSFADKNKAIYDDYPNSDYDFDVLLLGGGGILMATKLQNSRNLPYYIDIAMKKNKPIYIISCGLQGSVDNFTEDFKDWKKVFDYCSLITVRSPTDKEYIDKITDPRKVFYLRDLGYIYPHISNNNNNSKKTNKTLTLIIAGPINAENKGVKEIIDKTTEDIVIMNMGSLSDDDNNNRIKNWNIKNRNVKKYFGAARSKEFIFKPYYKEGDLDLDTTINVIKNSSLVLTGRYHGMIFSRSLSIPYDTMGMGTNKVLWELPVSDLFSDIQSSYDNIKMLRNSIGLSENSNEQIIINNFKRYNK